MTNEVTCEVNREEEPSKNKIICEMSEELFGEIVGEVVEEVVGDYMDKLYDAAEKTVKFVKVKSVLKAVVAFACGVLIGLVMKR